MFRIEDRIAAVLSWIHCVFLAAAVYIFAACLPVLEEAEAAVFGLHCLWVLIPVAASWFAVRKINGLPLYLLVGAVVTAAVLILSRDILAAVLSIFVFLMRTYPRVIRGKMLEDMPGDAVEIELWEIPTFLDYPKAVHCLLFIVVYFAVIISKRHFLLISLFYVLLAEIFLIYIYASVVRLKEFITDNRRIANLPVKTMQLMQRAVLCVTLFLLLLFVLPSILYGNEPLTRLSEIQLDLNVNLESEAGMMAAEADGMQEMLEMIGEQESFEWPEWLKQLGNVLMYLICAGGVAAVAVLLYQAFRRMMQNFANGQGEDEIILLDGDESEILRGERKKRDVFWVRTPGMKIRREYKKMVKKNLKTRPFGWETPTDLEQNAGMAAAAGENGRGMKDYTKFHMLYEKARYGKTECTKDELETFLKAKERDGVQ